MDNTITESSKTEEYILVAEDSAPNRNILAHLLKRFGYQVLDCDDGEKAWKTLESSRDKKIVGVFSDIMMPNMSGIEFLKKVRSDSQYKTMIFVLITAVTEKEYITEAKVLNVNGYILKPVTSERVKNKLRELYPTREIPKLTG
ncbi:MAG: response regulator [Pseudomonadota bacterium]|nr:response regulator [Pseudomonadota bacterium]